ncbi:MAG: DUF4834 family protein [Bacteroidaceae bacterium]|nr:DUF4834 family protein [Bacteroidaceae bacterium]
MFHILGFFFLLFIFIIMAGLSIVISVFRTIFGLGGHSNTQSQWERTEKQKNRQSAQANSSTNGNPDDSTNSSDHHKKIFSKDEGEYVDFEEEK